MRDILGFCGGIYLELEEGCLDISRHGDTHIYVDVVPLEREAYVFIPCPVLGDCIILPELF